VTGLALAPLAVAGNIRGREIEHPMAIIILDRLVTSTLLNLFVLPIAVPALREEQENASAQGIGERG
jgi:Cu/Ag efflux pump CusA